MSSKALGILSGEIPCEHLFAEAAATSVTASLTVPTGAKRLLVHAIVGLSDTANVSFTVDIEQGGTRRIACSVRQSVGIISPAVPMVVDVEADATQVDFILDGGGGSDAAISVFYRWTSIPPASPSDGL